jgi:hypothetical protein
MIKKKESRVLYKRLEQLKVDCVERQKGGKVINPDIVFRYHTLLTDYARELRDDKLLQFKVSSAAKASTTTTTGENYYFIDQAISCIEEALVYIRGEYDVGVLYGIELISDDELQERCKDLIEADDFFDRILRESTTILENRLREKLGESAIRCENGSDVIDACLKSVGGKLSISDDDEYRKDFHLICKHVYHFYRHHPHHNIVNETRENAFKFVLMIDMLISIINNAKDNEPATTTSSNQSER